MNKNRKTRRKNKKQSIFRTKNIKYFLQNTMDLGHKHNKHEKVGKFHIVK